MIDMAKEQLYTFTKLRKVLNERGIEITVHGIRGWADVGVKNGEGDRVFLEAVIVGGVRYSSFEAFQRFVADRTKGN